MFYVKAKISDECCVKIDITGENVFTLCPQCGREHSVDIVEQASGDFDLYDTAVYCAECSARMRGR